MDGRCGQGIGIAPADERRLQRSPDRIRPSLWEPLPRAFVGPASYLPTYREFYDPPPRVRRPGALQSGGASGVEAQGNTFAGVVRALG